MSSFLTDKRFPELAELDAYWTALKGTRKMPARSEINPRGIDGALSHTFILERIAPGTARIRLAGQRLKDLIGMELRAMPLTALISLSDRARMEDLIDQVCTSPGIGNITLHAEHGAGRPSIEARMKLWPLSDAQGRPKRILGGLSFRGVIGQAPRRFMVVTSSLRPIGGLGAPESSEFAEPATPFIAAPRSDQGSGRVPYLRLVKAQ
ncbi:PAS domain protein [Thalassovita gelatinovora]|uniref:PAS domain protein n=1 Tax=Thalassovita gelatinovora TaxID=53501 RepID=A0A0P1F4S6_THAGE|nr:PAS domain-containing protein [Thalassovita gelatinovora]CUH62827.1 PAS domain protein [Thalassovita gelatinovora]SEQ11026.1 PAS domain-containing protein [Thalassovita gelatinovora]